MLKILNVTMVVIVVINALSCVEEESTLGLQFIDDTSFELATWDTVTVRMSSVLLDSFPTSNNGRLLIGSYEDPDLGSVNASAYFKITSSIPSLNVDEEKFRYDSATLKLRYDGYHYYDTTQIQKLFVYELVEEMEPEEDVFYNTSEFGIKYENDLDGPLGEIAFLPKPFSNDTVEIRIEDRVGSEVFNTYFGIESDREVDFLDIIEGFNIRSDVGNSVVLGFLPSVEFVVYYRDFNAIPSEQRTLTFAVQNNTHNYFTHIEADQQNSVIQSIINSDNSLLSHDSNNQAYMMIGIGLGLRLELPYMRNILEDNPNIIINDAAISLKPLHEKFNSPKYLPELLEGTLVNEKNNLISNLLFTGILNEDDEFDRDTEYLFNIKNYVELQLSLEENNNNAILITPPLNALLNVDNLIVGDSQNDQYETKLKLNLIRIKND